MARRQAEFLASLGDSLHPSLGREKERERREKVPGETRRTIEFASGAKKEMHNDTTLLRKHHNQCNVTYNISHEILMQSPAQ